jgi:hypothetical protein
VGGGVCPRASIFASDTKALVVVDFSPVAGAFLAGAVLTAALFGVAAFLGLRALVGHPENPSPAKPPPPPSQVPALLEQSLQQA